MMDTVDNFATLII